MMTEAQGQQIISLLQYMSDQMDASKGLMVWQNGAMLGMVYAVLAILVFVAIRAVRR